MIRTNLFDDKESRKVTDSKGVFSILEYQKDISVSPEMAELTYFASMMEVRKRQLIANITKEKGVITQKGELQMILGDVMPTTNIDGVGDFMKKYVGGKVTGENAIRPKYTGEGTILLEPTFRYIILEDISNWVEGIMVEDGMFLACEDSVEMKVQGRSNVSSAVFGKEGLFNMTFRGNGIVALESPVPRNELVEIIMENDTVKIDGNMAIAWSKNLDFTVERTTPTLVGSMMAGEGLVNVFRGTGKILMAPVRNNKKIKNPETINNH